MVGICFVTAEVMYLIPVSWTFFSNEERNHSVLITLVGVVFSSVISGGY